MDPTAQDTGGPVLGVTSGGEEGGAGEKVPSALWVGQVWEPGGRRGPPCPPGKGTYLHAGTPVVTLMSAGWAGRGGGGQASEASWWK